MVGARRAVERWTPMRNLESRSAAWPLGMELDRLLVLGTASDIRPVRAATHRSATAERNGVARPAVAG